MDPTEVTHGVDSAPNLPCMDGKKLRQSATLADPVSKVLGDDNLLIEILLLIGYPTTLVRAALVCKRWLCHASDPAFLCRFRKLHPPRLLGFYVDSGRFCNSSRFVPMLPNPPEFNSIIRSASSILDACSNTRRIILDCCNGNVFMNTFKNNIGEPGSENIVLTPLSPERGMVVVPPYPQQKLQDGYFCTFSELFFKNAAMTCPTSMCGWNILRSEQNLRYTCICCKMVSDVCMPRQRRSSLVCHRN